MKVFKGTPGPWMASHHYNDVVTILDPQGLEIVTAEFMPIMQDYEAKLGIPHWADSTQAFRELPEEEQAANAYLIAAAPDLLEALQSIIELQTRGYVVLGDKYTDMARAAISKALGEE
ncbi:hypothetical protein ACWKYH_06750 [Enterobacter sp. UPMP2076]